MRKFTLLVIGLFVFAQVTFSQQDPMYTKYMFNSLAFNPAFAGSPEYMSVRLLYRKQWWAFDGAPTTQAFTIHTPFKERVGLGLSVNHDEIGATSTSSAFASYAYRIKFGEGKLSVGLQAGAMNWRADWSKLKFKDPRLLDESFANREPNRWLPNFGAGVFYYTQRFYIGASVPSLLEHDLRDGISQDVDKWAKLYRHFYFHAGGAWPLNGDMLIFKPSILIKSVGLLSDFSTNPNDPTQVGAPTEFDVDLSLLFYEAFWLGVSFRSAIQARQFGGASSFDSVDIWAAFYMFNGFRVGASYDYTLTRLQSHVQGTFELMLGYDFSYQQKKINTPRYF